jgi:isopentenyl phosphate kinase
MLILKLGGAAITDKAHANTPRLDQIQSIAHLLAQYPQPMILIHGAGSFGHVIAQEYDLQNGYSGEAQREALVQLQLQLHNLNSLVVENLVAAGLPAMTIHPASMCVMKGGRIETFWLDPILNMLNLGLLPVLYGDCVWDTQQTFGILSGDQLVVYLANAVGADRVAFGTDVQGVLDAEGKVIRQFLISAALTDHQMSHADVTGGMLGKLGEITHLKNPHTQVHIFNLERQLAQFLAGDEPGTRIILETSKT